MSLSFQSRLRQKTQEKIQEKLKKKDEKSKQKELDTLNYSINSPSLTQDRNSPPLPVKSRNNLFLLFYYYYYYYYYLFVLFLKIFF
jgi:hypothetical protein